MRDIITHEYFGVNYDRVWKVIKSDLLTLKEVVNKIKTELNSDPSLPFNK